MPLYAFIPCPVAYIPIGKQSIFRNCTIPNLLFWTTGFPARPMTVSIFRCHIARTPSSFEAELPTPFPPRYSVLLHDHCLSHWRPRYGRLTRSSIFVLYFEMVWWPFGSSYSGAIVEAPDTRLLISGGGGTTLRRGRKDFCFVQFVLVMGDIRYDALKMCCQRTITSWLPRIISISLAVNKQ